MLGKNYLCEDEHMVDITSSNECTGAAKLIGNKLAGIKLNSQELPKGCYIGKGGVWFNKHHVGSREANSRPICILKGRYMYLMGFKLCVREGNRF